MNEKTPGCGPCTMCCKVLRVDELEKPNGQWCKHCDIGSGCKIYADRPESCRSFDCVWLWSQHQKQPWPIELRPSNCHFVVSIAKRDPGIVLHVDPQRPDAWKSRVAEALINRTVNNGMYVFVVCGNARKMIRSSVIASA